MKSKNFLNFSLAVFFLLASLARVQSQTKAEQIDQLISRYTEYGMFNGSALVAENGAPIFKKGFGMANMEWDIPNAPDTKHRLGSVTKQFTAVLILQLVEQGKLDLHAPITKYLPNYPETAGDKITIHHLLTHTSGIPSYTDFPNFFNETSRDYYSPADFVKLFCYLPLEFMPGEKFAYCNSGYFLLGYIIEKVTGKTYATCLRENIFSPLQMTNTGFDVHQTILKNRASGYEKTGNGYINAPYLDMNLPYAAGSMYSTVEDLLLWDQALYTDKILSEKSRSLMFTKHIATRSSHYGYGWDIYDMQNVRPGATISITEHGGGINGFNTIISRITTDKHLVVLLNNTGGAPLDEMNAAIRNILYGKPSEMPKKSLAKTVYNTINEKGLAAGLSEFKALKNSDVYSLNEGEINAAGYQLLMSGKTAEAIEMFKLNVEAFPKSGNVYDSLGEAYLKAGNKKLALVNYKKSVELDPANENGKKVIAELSKK